MKIGILGFGVVGQGVYELLKDKHDIVKILALHHEANDIFCDDIAAVLQADIDCMIECLPDIEIAYDYLAAALKKGIRVITSNKAIMARHYEALLSLALEHDTTISFEASVAGGIPIMHRLQDMKEYDQIQMVEGILNGTTNYILDSIFTKNITYQQALKQAQELGYAEKDPASDICGRDVGYKAALLYNTIFDANIALKDIFIKGIEYLDEEALKFANRQDKVIRLIGHIDQSNVFVLPFFIGKDHILANIKENNNCVMIRSQNMASAYDIGQGAGRFPTASAICLDVSRPLRNQIINKATIKNEQRYQFYLSKQIIDQQFIAEYAGQGCITQLLSIDELAQIVKDQQVFIGGIYDQSC